MAKLHSKVIRALRAALKDVDDWLDDLPDGYVAGAIVSSSFNRMDHGVRQRKLARILKSALTAEEYERVGAIATLTPAEATVKAV